MPESRSARTRPLGRSLPGSVAAAAIPAVVLSGLGAAAPAASAVELPAVGTTLAPKLPTTANISAAQDRIAAHLVASHIPARLAAAAPASVVVKAGDTLSHIAVRHDVALSTILKANGLSAGSTIYPGQKIKLGGPAAPVAKKSSSTGSSSSSTHTVVSGDTLSGIAMKHGLGLSVLLKANGLSASSTIYPGQRIKLGGSASTGSSAAKSTSQAAASSASSSHTVVSGDTLSGIAMKHGLGLSVLLKANGLSASSTIYPGQRIKLGGSASTGSSAAKSTSQPAASSSSTHTVVSGDTLSGIAAKHGLGLSVLLKANGLSASSTIYPGQKLSVTGSTVSSTASSTDRKQLVPSTFLHYSYPEDTVRSANDNKYELLSRNLPSREEMKQLIASTARSMGVDPSLALAHAYQESGFNMAAVSPANAIGAMQVIPSSGEWASQLVGRKLNLLDPQDNAVAGVAIIRSLQRTSASVEIGIASYYQGQGSVKRNGMYSDTKRYVASVQAHQKSFQ